MDVIMWGFFTIYLSHRGALEPAIVTFLLGAAVLWALFRSFQRDMAVGFLADVWARNLLGLFSTPLTVVEYIVGLFLINVVKALAGATAAALVAWLLYSFNILPFLPAALPFVVVLMLFAISIGIIITGLIARYSTAMQTFAWSITGLLMPLSCVFYPLSALPRPLHPIALMLPTTHAFEGMRQVMDGGGVSITHLCAGLGLDAGYAVAAIALFSRLFSAARSRGLLVKLQ
jgi:ABC-2 type transport system permease protein